MVKSTGLSVELEPLPGAEGAPRANVALHDEETGALFHTTLALGQTEVPTDVRLETSKDLSELGVTKIFKVGKDTGLQCSWLGMTMTRVTEGYGLLPYLEEDLGETDSEVLLSEFALVDELAHHSLGALLRIVVTLGLSGSEHGVTVLEVGMEGSEDGIRLELKLVATQE